MQVLDDKKIWLLSLGGVDLSSMARGVEYFGMSRIIFPVFSLQDFITADLMVFLPGIAVCLYPAIKAARFTPVQAMRNI